MNATELREKTTAELNELATELRDEIFRLKMHLYTGQLENTADLRAKRRTVARILTIIGQRAASKAVA
jgi:large subunit ribosomal protein L29